MNALNVYKSQVEEETEGENLKKDDCIYRNHKGLSQWIFDDLTFYKINSNVPDVFMNLLDYQ